MTWLFVQSWHVVGGIAAALALALIASALVYMVFLAISEGVGRLANVALGRPASATAERWAPEPVERWLRNVLPSGLVSSPSPSES